MLCKEAQETQVNFSGLIPCFVAGGHRREGSHCFYIPVEQHFSDGIVYTRVACLPIN